MLKRLALLLPLLLSGPAWADPALWAVRGPHATVYLFGSFHMLRPGTDWQGPALRRAFAEAGRCWFEIVLPENPNELAGPVMLAGLDPLHRLADLLPPERRDQLAAAAQRAGIGDGIQMMRPWLAAMVLSEQPLVAAGYDPALGVDTVLQRQAKDAGKEVGGVETAQAQLQLLAGLSPDLALRLLTATLDDTEDGPALIEAGIARWLAGDPDGTLERLTQRLRAEAPELYRLVFTDRNEGFAQAVQGFLDGDGTVLLTIGAGHLAGPGNVRELLERRGLKVERVAD